MKIETMKIEATKRLSSSQDSDYRTAAQGTRNARNDVKAGWTTKSNLKGSRAAFIKHLEVTVGAAPEYANAYIDEACKLLKIPVLASSTAKCGELTPKQKKLDINNDGKITSDDLEKLRNGEKPKKTESSTSPTVASDGKVQVVPSKNQPGKFNISLANGELHGPVDGKVWHYPSLQAAESAIKKMAEHAKYPYVGARKTEASKKVMATFNPQALSMDNVDEKVIAALKHLNSRVPIKYAQHESGVTEAYIYPGSDSVANPDISVFSFVELMEIAKAAKAISDTSQDLEVEIAINTDNPHKPFLDLIIIGEEK